MKRTLATLMALCMMLSLAACGGSGASSVPASVSASAPSSGIESAPADGAVLNIWCWNDEFQSRFNDYYPEVKAVAEDKSTTTLNDGTIVKWTINPNENNNYQNKLDEALLAQDSAAADDKIDIFLIEADYALKYVDSDYTLDVRGDIGLTDADLSGQYPYTQDIATAGGKLKGVTWQATPGLFAYRRSIAKDVLGTDDPAQVQEALSDWDKFNAVAEQAAAKGYKMLSGYDDSYRTFSNNVSAPWVTGTTVTVDENLMKWVEQTKTYTDNGYNNKSSLWSVLLFHLGHQFHAAGQFPGNARGRGRQSRSGQRHLRRLRRLRRPAAVLLGRHMDLRRGRHRQHRRHCGHHAQPHLRQGHHEADHRGYAGLHQQRPGHGGACLQRLQIRFSGRPEPHRAVRRSRAQHRHEQRRPLRPGAERKLPRRVQGLF